MWAYAKRFVLLVMALSTISVALVACQTPAASGQAPDTSGGNVFRTPNPALATATPTFPPFTIGAWPSDYSPGNNAQLTIYVLCRVQPTNMTGPSTPPQPIPVTIVLGDPVNKQNTVQTDAHGLASWTFLLNDPTSGQPVVVTVYANWKGQTYKNQTFFTPSPTAKPTATAAPSATASPSVTASP